jgi:uncharacterized protein YecE (DUF72 family)
MYRPYILIKKKSADRYYKTWVEKVNEIREQTKVLCIYFNNHYGGHDGNIAPIELSARTLKDKYPDVIIACLEAWWTVIGHR